MKLFYMLLGGNTFFAALYLYFYYTQGTELNLFVGTMNCASTIYLLLTMRDWK